MVNEKAKGCGGSNQLLSLRLWAVGSAVHTQKVVALTSVAHKSSDYKINHQVLSSATVSSLAR